MHILRIAAPRRRNNVHYERARGNSNNEQMSYKLMRAIMTSVKLSFENLMRILWLINVDENTHRGANKRKDRSSKKERYKT